MRERRWARWRCSKTLGPGEKTTGAPNNYNNNNNGKKKEEKKKRATVPLRSLSLSFRRSLFICAQSLFFFFFLHWLELQVNGLQMVAAAAVAIFNTGMAPATLDLRAKKSFTRFCDF
jgi:hypothetical protein